MLSVVIQAIRGQRVQERESLVAGRDMVKLPHSDLSMSVWLAVSTGIVERFAAWLPSWETANPQHKAAQDLCLAAFCRAERLIVQATVPSLVQHRDADSFLGHPVGRRQSRTYRAVYGEIPC